MRRTRPLCLAILLFVTLQGITQEQIHELQRGETIYTLARRYGVSADTLLDYNSIADPTRLPVGAGIRIPGTYVVKEGEYIYSIALKLGIDWLELLQTNGLDENDLVMPGDILLVPSGRRSDAGATTADAVEPVTVVSPVSTAAEGTDEETVPAAAVSSTLLIWPHPGEREAFTGRFRGVAMAAETGDTFKSVSSGVVSLVGPYTSFGKLILVRAENGYLYGYAGADRVDVVAGQHVSNGTVLGSVGVSPAFQAARVLFTVWRDNRYIDPESAPRG